MSQRLANQALLHLYGIVSSIHVEFPMYHGSEVVDIFKPGARSPSSPSSSTEYVDFRSGRTLISVRVHIRQHPSGGRIHLTNNAPEVALRSSVLPGGGWPETAWVPRNQCVSVNSEIKKYKANEPEACGFPTIVIASSPARIEEQMIHLYECLKLCTCGHPYVQTSLLLITFVRG